MSAPVLAPQRSRPGRSAPVRVLALDVVRGTAIVAMLIVNNPGDRATTPWPLTHSEWHGLTPPDVFFPVFLVAMGASLPFSRRARRPGAVLRRVLLLWLVGAALSSVKYADVRLGAGVLQHIAGAYLVGWLLLRLPRRWPLAGAAGVLVVVWAAMTFAPGPGVEPGSWAPDRTIAASVDREVFGGATSEGVVATLASSVHVVFGAWLGSLFLRRPAPARLRRTLAAWSAAGIAGGSVLALAVPVNKKLWTPSYAVLTTGLAVLLVLVAHELLERRGTSWSARRLRELGENPLAVYVVMHLLTYTVLRAVRPPVVAALAGPLPPAAAGVAYSLLPLAGGVLLAHVLYRRGTVVRL